MSISRTPCVLRPITRMSATRRRMILPVLVTSIRLFSSVTCCTPTTRPARLDAILRHVGALAVAVLGDGEDARTGAQDLAAHHRILAVERDAFHAAGAAAHAAHFLFAEANRLPVARRQDHFLLSVGQANS